MTLLSNYLPKGIVVLDASVLINLLGCRECVAVLEGLRTKCLMEERTLKEVRKHPVPGCDHAEPLHALLSSGALEAVRMTEEEYETYLTLVSGSLAARLDDGESAALAISGRAASIVLDERKARRRAAEDPKLSACLTVASSLRLMLTSGYRQAWSVQKVRDLVGEARKSARMGVPKEDTTLLEELLAS